MAYELIFLIFITSLIFTDLTQRRLPNILVMLLSILGVYGAWLAGDLVSKAFAGVSAFSIFYFIRWFYHKKRGVDGLGMGDVKLMGAVGLWVGFSGLPWVIFLGSLFTLIFAFISRFLGQNVTKQTRLPLGAFLAFATALVTFN